jgi:hypothetical protein
MPSSKNVVHLKKPLLLKASIIKHISHRWPGADNEAQDWLSEATANRYFGTEFYAYAGIAVLFSKKRVGLGAVCGMRAQLNPDGLEKVKPPAVRCTCSIAIGPV